jgi:hypothetical protein
MSEPVSSPRRQHQLRVIQEMLVRIGLAVIPLIVAFARHFPYQNDADTAGYWKEPNIRIPMWYARWTRGASMRKALRLG